MKHSEQLNELAGALSQYQSEAQNPINSAKNPFFKNRYAPLNDILAMVRPEIAKYGLSVSQLVGGENCVSVTTMLLHKSGQFIADTISLEPEKGKGVSQAQAAGVVITYLRRYGVASILGLAGDDDNDGHDPSATPPNDNQLAQKDNPKNKAEQYSVAATKVAKESGCTDGKVFYKTIRRHFPGLTYNGDRLDWGKIKSTDFAEIIDLFKSGDWKHGDPVENASAVFEDDIPFE